MIIGLHGPQKSGKDTLAKLLSKAIPSVVIVKFADGLYDMAARIDPAFHPNMPHALKDAYLLDRLEFGTRRNFLQKLGTEFGRNMIHEDFWLELAKTKIKSIIDNYQGAVVIVTDVRFESEANWIRGVGTLIHLQPDWPTATSTHASDIPLSIDPADEIINLIQHKEAKGLTSLLQIVQAANLVDKKNR